MHSVCVVELPAGWVNAQKLDAALCRSGGPQRPEVTRTLFLVHAESLVMVDAAVSLLSLVNHLAWQGQEVTLRFTDPQSGCFSYLNRLGFFDALDPRVRTTPCVSDWSAARTFAGTSDDVMEITAIRPGSRVPEVPGRLSSLIACASDIKRWPNLDQDVFTMFAELIANIHEHSESPTDGFAALQVYHRSETAWAVVSDSGLGLLETVRPALGSRYSGLGDSGLVRHLFHEGVSRHGSHRGDGLPRAAQCAIQYQAKLHLRLATCAVHLHPSRNGYVVTTCHAHLPYMAGTHISFEFHVGA